jgi:RNA polymerase subunit RPABC4/transcription elongation factor Spt4
MKRIIPDFMQQPTPSKAVVEQAKNESTPTVARVENESPNACPICHRTYIMSEANGIAVMVCTDHAVVMPVKDVQNVRT